MVSTDLAAAAVAVVQRVSDCSYIGVDLLLLAQEERDRVHGQDTMSIAISGGSLAQAVVAMLLLLAGRLVCLCVF